MVSLINPIHEFLHTVFDDHFGIHHGRSSLRLPCVDNLGQIVHRVQIHITQIFHFRLDVSRHRQIHHEHGSISSHAKRTFNSPQPNQRQSAGCTADDNVEVMQLLW